MYININAAIKMLRFSATICGCFITKTITRYNTTPMITECNTIIRPFSIFLYMIYNLYRKLFYVYVFGGNSPTKLLRRLYFVIASLVREYYNSSKSRVKLSTESLLPDLSVGSSNISKSVISKSMLSFV
jgi:hypothetical protein